VIRKLPKGISLNERVLVCNYIGRVEGGENSNLIECILLFFVRQVVHLDLLKGVDLRIHNALHLINAGVGAFSKLAYNYEVL